MTNDPRIAAMRAATDFAVAKYPPGEGWEGVMFELADRWLAWHESKNVASPIDPVRLAERLAERVAMRGPNKVHPAWCECDEICRQLAKGDDAPIKGKS